MEKHEDELKSAVDMVGRCQVRSKKFLTKIGVAVATSGIAKLLATAEEAVLVIRQLTISLNVTLEDCIV